jgi:disulfide oxidoreductase YuzD
VLYVFLATSVNDGKVQKQGKALTPADPIKVTVIDDSRAEKCEGRCGLDFSSQETFESTAALLGKLFARQVQLEYLDLAEPSVSRLYADIVEAVRRGNLSLPLLLLDGKVRISGYFDISALQRVIQTEIEIRRG